MKKGNGLFIGVCLLCLSSCSPRIMVNVMKSYPKTVSDSVHVFELGQVVPNAAEVIGRVAVVDNGFSTNCQYGDVLKLAKEKTAEVGGNGLMLTWHKMPSLINGSCHQIEGKMLHLTDMIIDTTVQNPIMEAETKQQEIIIKERKRVEAPANTFFLQVGYGLITSNLYMVEGNRLKKVSPLGGLEWRFECNHTYKSGFGVSAIYTGYHREISTSQDYANIYIHYVAPALTYTLRVDRFIGRVGLGMGLGYYDAGSSQCAGFASNIDLRLEYMLSKKIGVNFALSAINNTLSKEYQVGDEKPIIQRAAYTTGIQFYF